MKKIGFIVIAFLLFTVGSSSAQGFDLSILDNAIGMVNQGNNKQASNLLTDAISGISKEVKGSNTAFAPKIASQLGNLSGMIPGLSSGKTNVGGLQKVINTIKTLVAANRLKKMLGGGSLLGKGKLVGDNTNLLSQGLSLIGGDKPEVSRIGKLLGAVSKRSSKLDSSGLTAKIAKKVIGKKLGSSLNMLEGIL
ncbi:hypothetical protein LAG90_15405 [Marinilongibacter aquaticus]|uniref:hypothetical protein n=1 Tax=Marinilongibacter aquaticus TaxID=2975157 RepID=UPI0021BD3563|nr:hypothetical protein [Marinilongibacter aquaticus]UBM58193.1 hypothetical protein LAG90_15405 [Marinilongibacter aquaticus]